MLAKTAEKRPPSGLIRALPPRRQRGPRQWELDARPRRPSTGNTLRFMRSSRAKNHGKGTRRTGCLKLLTKPRRAFNSFPATCAPGTVSITSANTGGGNNPSSQCAARKFLRISGARSPSSFALKNPSGFFNALRHPANRMPWVRIGTLTRSPPGRSPRARRRARAKWRTPRRARWCSGRRRPPPPARRGWTG